MGLSLDRFLSRPHLAGVLSRRPVALGPLLPTSTAVNYSSIYKTLTRYGTVRYLNHEICFLIIGILVLLALYFLMPSLAYIPKAILAAVIITSVIFLIELDIIKHLWKSRSIIIDTYHLISSHSINSFNFIITILQSQS